MNGIISDYIVQGVDLLITAVIVGAIVLLMQNSSQLNSAIVQQQSTTAKIKEYREYNQFDNTVVRQQDVISVIMQSRGTPEVYVRTPSQSLSYTLSGRSTEYKVVTLDSVIPANRVYKAQLVRGSNGEVVGYEFTYQ